MIPVKGKPFLMPAYTCKKCSSVIVIEKEYRPELKAARYGCQPRPTLFDRIKEYFEKQAHTYLK